MQEQEATQPHDPFPTTTDAILLGIVENHLRNIKHVLVACLIVLLAIFALLAFGGLTIIDELSNLATALGIK